MDMLLAAKYSDPHFCLFLVTNLVTRIWQLSTFSRISSVLRQIRSKLGCIYWPC